MIGKVCIALSALFSSAAVAAETDGRIRTQSYDANQIVRILGKSGIQSTIRFAPDERIENVAVGDSSAWQITPNRRASLLFVKPLTAHSRTNMTVVTDRRTYMFDLVAGDKSATAVYALKFDYPNEKPVAQPRQIAQAQAGTMPLAAATVDKLHFDWNTKGDGKLLPTRVFDDGTKLYLSWSKDTPLPAILTMSEDRKEGPVNSQLSGDYIVVSPIPANVVLRYGKKTATLWPSRYIAPQQQSPASVSGALASAPSPQVPTPTQPIPMRAAPVRPISHSPSATVLADVTSLYSDKLTDTRHGR